MIQSTDIKAISLATVGGLYCSESYYWDLNDRTRAWNDRVKTKTVNGVWPNMTQAGDYGVTPHPVYLFQASRRLFQASRRLSRRLFQAKTPAESKQPWDVAKVIATTPAEQTFGPQNEGGCPLVKA